ncbi:MAG: hypothetical protein J7L23_04945 [Candidatus Diapherotrites archaeon]|nr:hypothetical protein [Candidatus Diapherotrites archaeon]
MQITLKVSPSKFETLLVNIIISDLLTLFFLLAAVFNITLITLQIVAFPVVLVVVPTVSLMCAAIAFLRFYGYLNVVFRVMGALKRTYKEFDLKESEISINFKPPILLFSGVLHKHGQKSDAPSGWYGFYMRGKSDKYTIEESYEIAKGKYKLNLFVKDWHGVSHQRVGEGKLGEVQNGTKSLIKNIRKEVLEARGVDVQKIESRSREFISLPKTPPAPPGAKPRAKEVEPIEELEKSLEALEKLKSAEEAPQKMGIEKHEQVLKSGVNNASTPEEKESMQDALYQIQEIKKLLED